MCLAPTYILNPNRGRKDSMSYLVDTKSLYIRVPCGHCPQCVSARQNNIIQRLQVEELDSWLYYCTLTYNNATLPRVTCSNGVQIPYASARDFSLMVKRLKKSHAFGRPFRFLAVNELGEKRGRPHFHVIWIIPKFKGETRVDALALESVLFDAVLAEWRRNVGSTRKPIYIPLCTYVRRIRAGQLSYNYDLHFMDSRLTDSGNSDVAFYVTKYMFKPSDRETRLQQALKLNLVSYDDDGKPDYSEYEDVWKLVRPRMVASPNLGLNSASALKYVRGCIDRSKETDIYPKFYNPVSGDSFPLSRYYYRKNVYNVDDATHFYFVNPKPLNDVCPDEIPLTQIENRFSKYENQVKTLSEKEYCSTILNEISDD